MAKKLKKNTENTQPTGFFSKLESSGNSKGGVKNFIAGTKKTASQSASTTESTKSTKGKIALPTNKKRGTEGRRVVDKSSKLTVNTKYGAKLNTDTADTGSTYQKFGWYTNSNKIEPGAAWEAQFNDAYEASTKDDCSDFFEACEKAPGRISASGWLQRAIFNVEGNVGVNYYGQTKTEDDTTKLDRGAAGKTGMGGILDVVTSKFNQGDLSELYAQNQEFGKAYQKYIGYYGSRINSEEEYNDGVAHIDELIGTAIENGAAEDGEYVRRMRDLRKDIVGIGAQKGYRSALEEQVGYSAEKVEQTAQEAGSYSMDADMSNLQERLSQLQEEQRAAQMQGDDRTYSDLQIQIDDIYDQMNARAEQGYEDRNDLANAQTSAQYESQYYSQQLDWLNQYEDLSSVSDRATAEEYAAAVPEYSAWADPVKGQVKRDTQAATLDQIINDPWAVLQAVEGAQHINGSKLRDDVYTGTNTIDAECALFMKDEDRTTYFTLAATDPAKAEEFFGVCKNRYLLKERANYVDQLVEQGYINASTGKKIGMNLATIPLNLMGQLVTAGSAISNLATGELYSAYDPANDMTRLSTGARNATRNNLTDIDNGFFESEKVPDWLKKTVSFVTNGQGLATGAYDLATNVADNTFRGMLTGGLGELGISQIAASAINNSIMGLTSFGSAAYNNYEKFESRDWSYETYMMHNFAEGLNEIIQETMFSKFEWNFDVDQIVDKKSFMKYLASSFLDESLEEGMGAELDVVFDQVIARITGNETEFNQTIKDYEINGGYTHEQATAMAYMEYLVCTPITNAGAGGLSGILMGGGTGFQKVMHETALNNTYGQQINSNGIYNVGEVINQAMNSGDAKTKAQAERVVNELNAAGVDITGYNAETGAAYTAEQAAQETEAQTEEAQQETAEAEVEQEEEQEQEQESEPVTIENIRDRVKNIRNARNAQSIISDTRTLRDQLVTERNQIVYGDNTLRSDGKIEERELTPEEEIRVHEIDNQLKEIGAALDGVFSAADQLGISDEDLANASAEIENEKLAADAQAKQQQAEQAAEQENVGPEIEAVEEEQQNTEPTGSDMVDEVLTAYEKAQQELAEAEAEAEAYQTPETDADVTGDIIAAAGDAWNAITERVEAAKQKVADLYDQLNTAREAALQERKAQGQQNIEERGAELAAEENAEANAEVNAEVNAEANTAESTEQTEQESEQEQEQEKNNKQSKAKAKTRSEVEADAKKVDAYFSNKANRQTLGAMYRTTLNLLGANVTDTAGAAAREKIEGALASENKSSVVTDALVNAALGIASEQDMDILRGDIYRDLTSGKKSSVTSAILDMIDQQNLRRSGTFYRQGAGYDSQSRQAMMVYENLFKVASDSIAKVVTSKQGNNADKSKGQFLAQSADGSAVVTPTGKFRNENGNLMAEVDTGKGKAWINALTLQGADDAQAAMLNTVHGIAGTNARIAQSIWSGFEASEMNYDDYADAVSLAYQYGRSSLTAEQAVKDISMSEAMNDAVKAAHEAGRSSRNKRDSKQKSKAKGGKSNIEQWLSRDDLSSQQKSALKVLQKFVEARAVNIEIFESKADEDGVIRTENGRYDPNTNTIYIDINSGKNNEKQGFLSYAMARVFSHELTHYVQSYNAEGYQKLTAAVIEALTQNGQSFSELVYQRMAQIKDTEGRSAQDLWDEAVDEVVANACETMLRDSDMARNIANNVNKNDMKLGRKIVEFFRNIINDIKNAFKGVGENSREARELKRNQQAFERVQKIWDQALANAVENATEEQILEQVDELPSHAMFSGRDAIERSGDMVAVNNITPENLLRILGSGKWSSPSIAVCKAAFGNPFREGKISVVFNRETVDPGADPRNMIYGSDAWTPRYPNVVNVKQEARDKVDQLAKKYGSKLASLMRTELLTAEYKAKDALTKMGVDLSEGFDYAEQVKKVSAIGYAFLMEEAGEDFEFETEKEEKTSLKPIKQSDALTAGFDLEKVEDYRTALYITGAYTGAQTAEAIDAMSDKEIEENVITGKLLRKLGDIETSEAVKMVREAYAYDGYLTARGMYKSDINEDTHDAIREAFRQYDRKGTKFKAWLHETFGDEVTSTNGGVIKLDGQYVEATPENVTEYMNRVGYKNAVSMGHQNTDFRAAAAKVYRSTDAIKADADRIIDFATDESREIAENQRAEYIRELDKVVNDIADTTHGDQRYINKLIMSAMSDVNRVDLIGDLAELGLKLTDQQAKDLVAVMEKMANIKTGYFESKPRRTVGASEISYAIIPSDTSREVREALAKWGIAAYDYKAGDEQSRVEELNAAMDNHAEVRLSDRESEGEWSAFNGIRDTVLSQAAIDAIRNDMPVNAQIEQMYSRREDANFMAAAMLANKSKKFVSAEMMEAAAKMRSEVKAFMDAHEEEMKLPIDEMGDTWFEDASYGGTQENTLVCVRSLAAKAFMDQVSDELGRPLTTAETLFISQEIAPRMNKQECIYCYVAMDRRGYRNFLNRYMKERDSAVKAAKGISFTDAELDGLKDATKTGAEGITKAYFDFLAGRKNTANMAARYAMWMRMQDSKGRIAASDVANLENLESEMSTLTQDIVEAVARHKGISSQNKWEIVGDSIRQHKTKNIKSKAIEHSTLSEIAETDSALADKIERFRQLRDAAQYAQSASWAKKQVGYAAYNGHILKWKPQTIKKLNQHYGMRMYSFSDFSPAFILENMQMITDAAVKGLKVLAYTKEMDFVDIFAPSGMNMNISTFAYLDPSTGEVKEDNMQGAGWTRAQEARAKYPGIGIVMVATNDKITEWAMQQPWIDVVIPFHTVRTGEDVAEWFGYQNNKNIQGDAKAEDFDEYYKNLGKDPKKQTRSVSPTEHHNDIVDYVDALEKYHLTPRFAKWLKGYDEFKAGTITEQEFREMNPYYMKLVNETRRAYNETSPVQPVFNLESAMSSMKTLISEGGYMQYVGGSAEQSYTIAGEIAEQIKNGEVDRQIRLKNSVTVSEGDVDDYNAYDSGLAGTRNSARETDEDVLEMLNNQEYITTYRAMQVIDGKLYPPMAAEVNGKLEDPSEIGVWEKSVEHPEGIQKKKRDKDTGRMVGQFKLEKGKLDNGKKDSLFAAYNPYMHSSNVVLNDQFTGAYQRSNLVTVECRVPTSEMNGTYWAEFAKDPTGWHEWKSGIVAGELAELKPDFQRNVFLSRWIMPVRVLSDDEVAQKYKEHLDGTDLVIPENVVSPGLYQALQRAGVATISKEEYAYRGDQRTYWDKVDEVKKAETAYKKALNALEKAKKSGDAEKIAKAEETLDKNVARMAEAPVKLQETIDKYTAKYGDLPTERTYEESRVRVGETRYSARHYSYAGDDYRSVRRQEGTYWAYEQGILEDSDWRRYEDLLQRIRRGEKVYKTRDRKYFATLDTAIVLTNGSYNNPKLFGIIKFESDIEDPVERDNNIQTNLEFVRGLMIDETNGERRTSDQIYEIWEFVRSMLAYGEARLFVQGVQKGSTKYGARKGELGGNDAEANREWGDSGEYGQVTNTDNNRFSERETEAVSDADIAKIAIQTMKLDDTTAAELKRYGDQMHVLSNLNRAVKDDQAELARARATGDTAAADKALQILQLHQDRLEKQMQTVRDMEDKRSLRGSLSVARRTIVTAVEDALKDMRDNVVAVDGEYTEAQMKSALEKQSRSYQRQIMLLKERLKNANASTGTAANTAKISDTARETYAKQIEDMNARMEMLRSEYAQKLAKEIQKRDDSLGRIRNSRKATEIRDKIRRIMDDFNSRLNHPKENRYIPADMIGGIVEAMEAFDMSYRRNGEDVVSEKIKKMQEVYERYKTDGQYTFYNDLIAQRLDQLRQDIGQTKFRNLNIKQLEAVHETMKALHKVVTDAVKLKTMKEYTDAYQAGTTAIEQVKAADPMLTGKAGEMLNWMASPDNMFKRLGGFVKNGVLSRMQKSFVAGEQKMLEVQRAYVNKFAELTKTDSFKALNKHKAGDLVEIDLQDLETGENIKLTRGMMLALYMHLSSKDNLEGIARGGIKIPALRKYYEGNPANAYQDAGAIRTAGVLYRLQENEEYTELQDQIRQAEGTEEKMILRESADAIFRGEFDAEVAHLNEIKNAIEEQLTEDEKRMIETAHEWNDKDSRTYINDVSMDLYGFKLANVENYFPIHRDTNFLNVEFQSVSNDASLQNMGFLKERVKASQPILLMDFAYEMSSSVDKMSRYVGFARAERDFNLLYRTQLPGMTTSLREQIGKKFGGDGGAKIGVTGMDYVENYINDIIGNNRSKATLWDDIRSNLARSTLTLNPRVALSQAASIPTAIAELDIASVAKATKDIGIFFNRKAKDQLAQDDIWFWQRYRGEGGMTEFSDARKNANKLDRIYNTIADSKVGKALMNWCQDFDVGSTAIIHKATEYWVESHMGLHAGTDEYREAVAEKYREVLRRTQPMYTTTARSDLMRSADGIMKTFTMFKTQASQNMNALYSAAAEFAKFKKDLANGENDVTAADVAEARGRYQHTIVGVALGAVAYAVFRFMANAVMGKKKKYKDKETGDMTMVSTIKGVGLEALSSLSSMVVFGDLIWNAGEAIITKGTYYGISETAVGQISDLAESTIDVIQGIGEKNFGYKVYTMFSNLAGVTGIPMDNIKNISDMISSYVNGITSGDYEASSTRTDDGMYNSAITAMLKGNDNSYNTIMQQNMDMSGKSLKEAQTGLKNRIAKWYESGDLDRDTALSLLTGDKLGIDEDDAYWILDKAEYKRKHGGKSDGYSEALAMKSALESGDEAKIAEAVDYYKKHGYRGKVESAVKAAVKEMYSEGTIDWDGASELLVKYGGMIETDKKGNKSVDENGLYWIQQEWDWDIGGNATEAQPKYSKYTGIDKAIEDMDMGSATEQIKAMTERGVSKSSLASHFKSIFKDTYMELLESDPAAAEQYLSTVIIPAYVAAGYKESYERKYIAEKWVD